MLTGLAAGLHPRIDTPVVSLNHTVYSMWKICTIKYIQSKANLYNQIYKYCFEWGSLLSYKWPKIISILLMEKAKSYCTLYQTKLNFVGWRKKDTDLWYHEKYHTL